jgi:hypothetical protein
MQMVAFSGEKYDTEATLPLATFLLRSKNSKCKRIVNPGSKVKSRYTVVQNAL